MRGGSGGIPEGWVHADLEDVCEINPPRLPDDATEADLVSFVPMAAVEEENGGIDVAAARPLKEVRKGYTQFRSGDVLLAKITPCMENGKLAVVPAMASSFGYGSTEFFVLRPGRPEFAPWIARYLSRRSFRDAARHHMQGAAGQLRVPKKWLQTVEIPVAPLPEQRRIVTKLDELFSELDAGVAALERAQAKLERYRASVLKAAVEGRLTERWRQENLPTETGAELLERILAERRRRWEEAQLAAFEAKGKKPPRGWREKYKAPVAPHADGLPELPEGWCWATVDQLGDGARPIAYGVLQPGPHVPAGVPLVRVGDINDGLVGDELKRVAPHIDGRYPRTSLSGGEVLVTIVGTIGRTAIAPAGLSGANTARAVAVIPPNDLIGPGWLELWLAAPEQAATLASRAHEVARKTLNLEDLRSAPVALPPLAEQRVVTDLAETCRIVVRTLASQLSSQNRRTSHLRQSILKHAFEGRLVPQDPNDEPASALLARIRAEREKARGAPVRGPGARRRSAGRPRPTN